MTAATRERRAVRGRPARREPTGAAGTTGGAGTTGAAGTTGGAGTTGAGGTTGAAGTAGSGRGGSAGAAGSGGGGGSGGSGGSGGLAGGGGGASGGRGGTGGGASGGRGGTGGGASGGRGGTGGGASGGSGGAGPGPECTTAADCKLFTDCCTCEAIPVGATHETCPAICIQSNCDARQVPRGAVACVAGQCVAGFACDARQVTCRIAPPTCPAGEVPAVNDTGTCYLGTCAPRTECLTVGDCGVCPGVNPSCVRYQTQLGTETHCVTIPLDCGFTSGCSCFGPAVCVPPYVRCSDTPSAGGVACSCPNC